MNTPTNIRQILLEIINNLSQNPNAMLQEQTVLQQVQSLLRINSSSTIIEQQALLTEWYDLFRIGFLYWGSDLNNIHYPWFHVTEKGRKAFASLSKDPSNPAGYLQNLKSIGNLSHIGESYIIEALSTFSGGNYKASAVMLGCATETVIFDLRDLIINRLNVLGKPLGGNNDINSWQIKKAINGIARVLEPQKHNMSNNLKEDYEFIWHSFIQVIRSARNNAGHPESLDPIREDQVHAGLLMFPNLLKLSSELASWVTNQIF